MIFQERTKDLYEEIAGYPQPPLIPLPEPDDIKSFEGIGFNYNSLSCKILRMTLKLAGFKKFQQSLPNNLPALLKKCNLRQLEQWAPIISATVAMSDDPRSLTPLERAATLVLGARQLCREIRNGTLPPDRYNGQPLEMGQYPNLFSTSIIWEGKRAGIFKSANTANITVAVKKRLYSVDIGEIDSAEISITSLLETFRALVDRAQASQSHADNQSLGLLTCAITATQSKAFRLLQKKRENHEVFTTLRHTYLTICLDLEHFPQSDAEAAHMAHSRNCGNRWHHSSLQLVVFGNAKACAIFNYNAYIDGNIMMRGAAEIYKHATNCTTPSSPTNNLRAKIPTVTELVCKLDISLIQQADREMKSIIDNQPATYTIRNFGRDLFKQCNMDPVPAFVLALHMTISQFVGKSVKIEQHLALSKYRFMGLTTAMVTTPEVIHFSEIMAGENIHYAEARKFLKAAIESQKEVSRKARRHLPFSQILSLFINTRTGSKRIYGALVSAVVMLLGRKDESEVIISHPWVFPETPIMGRPGIRLPYVKYLGLHYQVRDKNITVTFMPGLNWSVPNAEVITVLQDKLQLLKGLAKREPPQHTIYKNLLINE